jgi:hypothetical protein
MAGEHANMAARVAYRYVRSMLDGGSTAVAKMIELADKLEKKWGLAHCFVYKGVNEAKKQIYYGVSKEPKKRILDGHIAGETKAVEHWDFDRDGIRWFVISEHWDQPSASEEAHRLEGVPVPGYEVIKTAGI